VQRGPEGLYQFKAVTKSGSKIESDTWTIFLKSEVGTIEAFSKFKGDFTIGEPFSV